MKTTLRKIGNSTAVIIPKPFLVELGFDGDEIEMTVENDAIVIRKPVKEVRLGWAQASEALAQSGEDALQWPSFPNQASEDVTW